jgi:flagellar biosynthesis protein FlgN
MFDIAAITKQEASLVGTFIKLLKKEQDALKLGEVSALATLGEQKETLVRQLNLLEVARGETLGSAGHEHIPSAMKNWLHEHPEALEAAANWKQLLTLAREAKHLHELNGRLVAMHLQQTDELLGALTNQSRKNSLYGSDGQAAPITGSRLVDSA